MSWEPVIGLEVHVQLSTKTKLFSGAPTTYGAVPNTQACGIDLGLPGILPVLNREAIRLAVRLGLSIQAHISQHSVFARKNYFYPDLPKGYQISQYELPIVCQGKLDIELDDGSVKTIGITRAHLEEDAGKSIHEGLEGWSGIDLNRAGTPLLEIVSEPDMSSPEEAVAYLKTLHTLVRYLQISDANMQEGAFRCDVNVSLRRAGSTQLGTRAEIKNINSFRFVDRAIRHEITRQTEVLTNGGTVIQETRLYDAAKDETRSMRSKEEAHDYRYFPDPDLLPLTLTQEFIDTVKKTLPELPWEKRTRFKETYGLSIYDAKLLSTDWDTAQYFEDVLKTHESISPKLAANWINGELAGALNKANIPMAHSPVTAQQLADLLRRIADHTISTSMAKQVFEAMWSGIGEADSIIEQQELKQVTDTAALEKIVNDIIARNPDQVAQYRAGKEKLIGFFVGQVMKATQGKAHPQQVNEILQRALQDKSSPH